MAGIDPATGTIPEGIEAQTDQALVNLAAVLGAAGASMADVVKTTIFYADVEDFARLNEVYARHMPDPRRPVPPQPTSGCPTACSSRSRRSPKCRASRTTSATSHQSTGAASRIATLGLHARGGRYQANAKATGFELRSVWSSSPARPCPCTTLTRPVARASPGRPKRRRDRSRRWLLLAQGSRRATVPPLSNRRVLRRSGRAVDLSPHG